MSAVLSIILFIVAQGWTGYALALLGFTIAILPVTAYQAWKRQTWGWRAAAALITIIALVLLSGILITTPGGVTQSGSPVQNRFTTPGEFPRYSIANIVPEMEQVNLGFLVMPYLDPILTHKQATEVSKVTMDIYQDMERDPDFHQLGSAMKFAYADLFGQDYDAGHYYLYIPQNKGEEPLPALVFLHGSAGNFKAYTWLLSRLAEEQGMVIITPTFGFGQWNRPGGAEAVIRALDDAMTVVEIDQERVFLARISNGGLGVSRLAATVPERFKGLIFLSPVMATHLLESSEFLESWAARPVLLLSGEADKRVPHEYVEFHVQLLESAGVHVTNVVYAKEDHFLFFSRPDDVLDTISEWLLNH